MWPRGYGLELNDISSLGGDGMTLEVAANLDAASDCFERDLHGYHARMVARTGPGGLWTRRRMQAGIARGLLESRRSSAVSGTITLVVFDTCQCNVPEWMLNSPPIRETSGGLTELSECRENAHILTGIHENVFMAPVRESEMTRNASTEGQRHRGHEGGGVGVLRVEGGRVAIEIVNQLIFQCHVWLRDGNAKPTIARPGKSGNPILTGYHWCQNLPEEVEILHYFTMQDIGLANICLVWQFLAYRGKGFCSYSGSSSNPTSFLSDDKELLGRRRLATSEVTTGLCMRDCQQLPAESARQPLHRWLY
ncbi:hypothetical protein C8Q70DRAFT_1122544 [Cubamyces menziesii]|nr:hypothetical protein C8Q70DRAFT_1122544 [Cubamyces menziesii]